MQVLQFIQLVQPVDRVSAQVVVLWLLLLEALTAPHVLWVLSRRYRHALVYVWTVHVLRDTSAKEEGKPVPPMCLGGPLSVCRDQPLPKFSTVSLGSLKNECD